MIKLQNICKTFNEGKNNEKKALKNVSLDVNDGELVAIIGKSGAGKSTLLNIVACLDTPSSGEYLIDGENTANFSPSKTAEIRNGYFGVVTQSPFMIDNITPLENVVIPLMYDRKNKKDRYRRAAEALASVGIDSGLKVKTAVLSGGEQQRVSIARAIVNNPRVILADEPTGNLDKENSDGVMKILLNINKEGRTVIVITHDPDIAAQCGRVVTVSDGEIIKDEKNTYL